MSAMVELHCKNFDLAAIAKSGQCFRLTSLSAAEYLLIANGRQLCLTALPDGAAFHCTQQEFDDCWAPYFDLTTDYSVFCAAAPQEDLFLREAVRCGEGLRILRQEPWEVLVSFIISQRKNIPAIQKSVEALCRLCGEPLPAEEPIRYAFPSPARMAALSMEELCSCSLGYRARYLHEAALMVSEGRLDLAALGALDDAALQEALLTIPGVGVKVANCVMLFGYHRLSGFPRDVWINRVIDTVYGGDFPLEPYRGFEGVIQQYLFCYARSRDYREKYGI